MPLSVVSVSDSQTEPQDEPLTPQERAYVASGLTDDAETIDAFMAGWAACEAFHTPPVAKRGSRACVICGALKLGLGRIEMVVMDRDEHGMLVEPFTFHREYACSMSCADAYSQRVREEDRQRRSGDHE